MDLAQPLKMICGYMSKPFKKSNMDKVFFILYKIVDSYPTELGERYRVQCINTKAILELTVEDIVFDLDILYGLHPVQACFVGIEYAKLRQTRKLDPENHGQPINPMGRYAGYRYGSLNLLYQNRHGLLGFTCLNSGEEFLMDPRDIALSRELIEEFDVAHAFCIGVMAGNKMINPVVKSRRVARPSLKLVKG